jgi:hypothetical protein
LRSFDFRLLAQAACGGKLLCGPGPWGAAPAKKQRRGHKTAEKFEEKGNESAGRGLENPLPVCRVFRQRAAAPWQLIVCSDKVISLHGC